MSHNLSPQATALNSTSTASVWACAHTVHGTYSSMLEFVYTAEEDMLIVTNQEAISYRALDL